MATTLKTDYLVVGAGAMGMAFTDALIDNADVSVTIIDRRHRAGGHWLDAYPFVRLHLSSSFYGVASTLLGDGRNQTNGPEAGWQERASGSEVCAYYVRVMERLTNSGKVHFYPNCEYLGRGQFVSLVSGEQYQMAAGARTVIGHYLSPDIPACTKAPFRIGDDARVIPVNDLVRLPGAPSQFVIVGSGKTATDACIWLLGNGVDPDKICWVRPRDPWMFDRAAWQPDPAVYFGMSADIMEAAASASTAEEMFFRMEEAGIMLRLDPSVTPTMAKLPTVARWEVDELRSVENVVRLGHVQAVTQGRIWCAEGEVATAEDAVVVHCAASGLQYPPLEPVWGPEAITLQLIGNGLPCFGAALAGFVEATRDADDEKNRVCPPCPYPGTTADFGRMQVLADNASAAWSNQSDIEAWANQTTLNPARIPSERANDADVQKAVHRFQTHAESGLARLAEMSSRKEP